MSEPTNMQKCTIVPSIADVGNSANSINDLIENINNNFSILANHDFIKGEPGDSSYIKTEYLIKEDAPADITDSINKTNSKSFRNYLTDLGELLYNAIITEYKTDYDKTLNGRSIWSSFIENPGQIQTFYTNNERISSLYYVFLDGRYNTTNLHEELDYTDNFTDASCIMVYDYEAKGFKILKNAFPTVYYEMGVGLCWKINGNKTGLPVRGPQGKNGTSSKLFICKTDKPYDKNNDSVVITSVYEPTQKKYVKTSEFFIYNYFQGNDFYTALIYCPTQNSDSSYTYDLYFGYIKPEKETSTIDGFFDIENSINTNVAVETFLEALSKINIKQYNIDTASLPGLFIPIETASEDKDNGIVTQKSHLFTATSITNAQNDQNKNTDLVLAPVNDIHNLKVNDTEDNNLQLQVNKYLYLKIDQDVLNNELENWNNTFSNENESNNIKYNLVEYFNEALKKINYTLKYKLTSTITNREDNIFTTVQSNINDIAKKDNVNCIDIASAMVLFAPAPEITPGEGSELPELFFKENITKNDNIGDYKKAICYFGLDADNELFASTDYSVSLPNTIKNRLKNSEPLYRWTLDLTKDKFDPEELKNCNKDNPDTYHTMFTYKNKDIDIRYVLALFNSIFTTSISPDENTTIFRFNGFYLSGKKTVNTDDYKNYYNQFENDAINTYRYAINGWDTVSDNAVEELKDLKFIIFNPNLINTFDIPNDTSLNINYNVNITGNNNDEKNLYINGNIKSKEIYTNELHAKEIRNFYSKDEVIADNKIKIINSKEENSNTTIISNDDIYTNNLITNNLSLVNKKSEKTFLNCISNYSKVNSTVPRLTSYLIDNHEVNLNINSDKFKLSLGPAEFTSGSIGDDVNSTNPAQNNIIITQTDASWLRKVSLGGIGNPKVDYNGPITAAEVEFKTGPAAEAISNDKKISTKGLNLNIPSIKLANNSSVEFVIDENSYWLNRKYGSGSNERYHTLATITGNITDTSNTSTTYKDNVQSATSETNKSAYATWYSPTKDKYYNNDVTWLAEGAKNNDDLDSDCLEDDSDAPSTADKKEVVLRYFRSRTSSNNNSYDLRKIGCRLQSKIFEIEIPLYDPSRNTIIPGFHLNTSNGELTYDSSIERKDITFNINKFLSFYLGIRAERKDYNYPEIAYTDKLVKCYIQPYLITDNGNGTVYTSAHVDDGGTTTRFDPKSIDFNLYTTDNSFSGTSFEGYTADGEEVNSIYERDRIYHFCKYFSSLVIKPSDMTDAIKKFCSFINNHVFSSTVDKSFGPDTPRYKFICNAKLKFKCKVILNATIGYKKGTNGINAIYATPFTYLGGNIATNYRESIGDGVSDGKLHLYDSEDSEYNWNSYKDKSEPFSVSVNYNRVSIDSASGKKSDVINSSLNLYNSGFLVNSNKIYYGTCCEWAPNARNDTQGNPIISFTPVLFYKNLAGVNDASPDSTCKISLELLYKLVEAYRKNELTSASMSEYGV